MSRNQNMPLVDEVAMLILEIDLKNRMANPTFPLRLPEEVAKELAKTAYIVALAMSQESMKLRKEWVLVKC